MAAGNASFAKGDFEKADQYFSDVRTHFPSSEHQFHAHYLGIQSKLHGYRGANYTGDSLEETDKLIQQVRRQFPRETARRQQEIDRAARETTTAGRTGMAYGPVLYLPQGIRSRSALPRDAAKEYGDTPFADEAREEAEDERQTAACQPTLGLAGESSSPNPIPSSRWCPSSPTGTPRSNGSVTRCGRALHGCPALADRRGRLRRLPDRQPLAVQHRHRTVHVPMFQSDSLRPDLGEWLTEAVIKEIEMRTPYKVVSNPLADSVLTGRLLWDNKRVVSENINDEPRNLIYNAALHITWIDSNGRIMAQSVDHGRRDASFRKPASRWHRSKRRDPTAGRAGGQRDGSRKLVASQRSPRVMTRLALPPSDVWQLRTTTLRKANSRC